MKFEADGSWGALRGSFEKTWKCLPSEEIKTLLAPYAVRKDRPVQIQIWEDLQFESVWYLFSFPDRAFTKGISCVPNLSG